MSRESKRFDLFLFRETAMVDPKAKEIVIHDREWDSSFLRGLLRFVAATFNAEIENVEVVGPVGSQVLETTAFRIRNQQCQILAETYMGVRLSGPSELVDEFVNKWQTHCESNVGA